MDVVGSEITSLTIVYSTVYSDADQRKYQSSASLAFVRGIHRSPVNSPHKGLVTRKMFPFDDVIMGIWGVNELTHEVWYHEVDIQEKMSAQCSGRNWHHAKYGFSPVWWLLIWFQQEIMQTWATPNALNLSSKWEPQRWVLVLLQRKCGLIHKLFRSINLLSTTFRFSSNWFEKILVYI